MEIINKNTNIESKEVTTRAEIGGRLYTFKTDNNVFSKKYLDFGKGFYVTTFQSQAEKWAKRKCLFKSWRNNMQTKEKITKSADFIISDFKEILNIVKK